MVKGMRIPCIVTGKLSYFSAASLEKKINKFGSTDDFSKHYVCPAARKLLRKGMSVNEVRDTLKITEKLPAVSLDIISRLKLLKKKSTRKNSKEQEDRQRYLNSKEFRDKMRALEEKRNNMTFREWVEDHTGGPDRVWLRAGACTGTCIRPDIFLSRNDRACDGCPYHVYCLCRNNYHFHYRLVPPLCRPYNSLFQNLKRLNTPLTFFSFLLGLLKILGLIFRH